MGRICQNLQKIRSITGKSILFVVKANAYSHGAIELVPKTKEYVDAYGVADCEEGISLKESGCTKPILIMGEFDNAKSVVRHLFTPLIFTKEQAKNLQKEAYSAGKILKVHIKVDCGMGRFGLTKASQSKALAQYISDLPNLRLTGIASHYSSCEKQNIINYNAAFREHIFEIEKISGRLLRHFAATSTALLSSGMYDMLRVGIGAYGYGKGMHPAMQVISKVIAVKKMEKGNIVGYNQVCVSDMTDIAIVSGGYADGIMRRYVGSYVTIREVQHQIISVCMDSFIVKLNSKCKAGDIVKIIDNKNSAEYFAENNDTICYEILTALRGRAKRIYI